MTAISNEAKAEIKVRILSPLPIGVSSLKVRHSSLIHLDNLI
jgi:hypothetical protein